MAHAKHTTDYAVGPGVYHTNDIENLRNGWGNRSFSKRQPMTPPSRGDRGDYVHGAVLHKGQYMAAPLSTHSRKSPGVGVYNLQSSFGKVGSSPLIDPRNMGSTSGRLTCPSPRDATKTVVLPNGLLAQSIEANNCNLGPGTYNVASDMIKPSHNKRIKGHNRTGSDQSARTQRSSQSSMYSYSPNRNGAGTPRSISSGRSNRSQTPIDDMNRYSYSSPTPGDDRPERYTFENS
jgi:hypothetical protein